jgi:hypothetical protein
MTLAKTLKNLCSNHMVILTVVAALVLIYFVNNYSAQKGIIQSGMTNSSGIHVTNDVLNAVNAPNVPQTNQVAGNAASCCAPGAPAGPAAPLGQNAGPAGVTGVRTDMHGLPPSCTRQPVVDPKQLLPRDGNNQFSKMNPMGAGDVANVSLLKAGYHIGINTVGQSLRNANLQLRSEPANPQLNVGPWNTSTIGPDFNRRPMEIGCGPK